MCSKFISQSDGSILYSFLTNKGNRLYANYLKQGWSDRVVVRTAPIESTLFISQTLLRWHPLKSVIHRTSPQTEEWKLKTKNTLTILPATIFTSTNWEWSRTKLTQELLQFCGELVEKWREGMKFYWKICAKGYILEQLMLKTLLEASRRKFSAQKSIGDVS